MATPAPQARRASPPARTFPIVNHFVAMQQSQAARTHAAVAEDESMESATYEKVVATCKEGFRATLAQHRQHRVDIWASELTETQLPMALRRASVLTCELVAARLSPILFQDATKENRAVYHGDNSGATFGIIKGQLKCPLSTAVFKSYGWKLPEQLKPNFFATKRGKISNHYNGTKRKIEKYEKYEEDFNSKRPKAPNVVPRFYSQQWPMPDQRILFLFPEEGPSLMAEGGLGTRNSRWRAGQLQSLTFDNLNRYSQLFEPIRAMPPDLTRLPLLELREQRIFGMWSITGLRKCSLSSIRKDCLTVSEDQRFVKAMIPSIKSLPVPGEYFYAYIPKDIFYNDVFPVTPMELDAIAHKLHTTSHGVRRALALQLRRRCAEIGLRPDPDSRHSKEYLVYRQKVSDLFGWTCSSTMWEDVYSKDIAIHRNATFSMRPAVDRYFTGQELTTVLRPIKKTMAP
eukprot:g5052.t1